VIGAALCALGLLAGVIDDAKVISGRIGKHAEIASLPFSVFRFGSGQKQVKIAEAPTVVMSPAATIDVAVDQVALQPNSALGVDQTLEQVVGKGRDIPGAIFHGFDNEHATTWADDRAARRIHFDNPSRKITFGGPCNLADIEQFKGWRLAGVFQFKGEPKSVGRVVFLRENLTNLRVHAEHVSRQLLLGGSRKTPVRGERSLQAAPDQSDGGYTYYNPKTGYYEGPEGPLSNMPLGAKILLFAPFFAVGVWISKRGWHTPRWYGFASFLVGCGVIFGCLLALMV
jgi:hypothetical protein